MKVSIIIPTYKPGEYLWDSLRSITFQDFSKEEFEVIIVLNGNCQPYFNNIEAYIDREMKGFNVHLLQTDTVGVSHARNMGMNFAKGEWITFVDDDDKISPSFLSALYQVSSKDCVAISNVKCFTDAHEMFFDDYLSRSYMRNSKKINCRLFDVRSFMSTACCKLIPAHIIHNSRFNTCFTHGEDALFMFLISKRIKEYILADSGAVYFRRVRPGSASRSKSKIFVMANRVRLFISFFRIYFSSPLQYNLSFFLTRIAAVLFK